MSVIIEIKVFVKFIYEILLFKKDMELLERTAKKLITIKLDWFQP